MTSATATPALAARRAGTGDLAGLVGLESSCFGPDERWSAPSWQAELDGDDRAVWVAVRTRRDADAGGCQAFDEVVAACCVHLAGEDAELFRVMTAPALRGLGVATMLVSAGLAWARAHGAVRMLLEVRHDNVTARSLYADLGFTDLYLRTNYYGYGLDAVVMSRPVGEPTPPEPTLVRTPANVPTGKGLWSDLHDEGDTND
ncbi:MAG: GNAT family N-acetyltransferase [Propionibacteriaceae bacterium]|nr:GNAT family N-acetyltransferase [Propionibacteriaceae bacterium]